LWDNPATPSMFIGFQSIAFVSRLGLPTRKVL
jgi:hypothetical protein